MKYRVVKSFVGHYYDLDSGAKIQVSAGMGDVIEIPEYLTDWVQAGFMVPESAMLKSPQAKGRKVALRDVPGVAGHEDELAALAIHTAAELAAADARDLQTIKGVGEVTARRWIKAAQDLLT